MKKLIATFGILALAACGGGDAEEGTFEDTTAVTPVTETAPVTTTPMDTTMAPTTMPADTGMGATGTMTDTGATGTTTTP